MDEDDEQEDGQEGEEDVWNGADDAATPGSSAETPAPTGEGQQDDSLVNRALRWMTGGGMVGDAGRGMEKHNAEVQKAMDMYAD